MLITRILPLLLLGMFVIDCGNREKAETTDNSARVMDEHEFRQRLDQVNPGLSDPAAVIELIRMSGASFLDDLVNLSGPDAIYHLDSALSALNLGIYTVDIAYLAAYEKHEAVDLQLDKARELAGNVGAGHLYDHGILRRYQVAGLPVDSLLLILKHAAEQLEHEFSQMELMRFNTLFVTGEFIEKLHLTTQLLIHADHENEDSYLHLMMLLFHQENSLRQLISLLDQVRGSEEGERFMAMLDDLQLIFLEINTPGELADINTSNLAGNQTFNDLIDQVLRIRNQIIDPVYP
jgi:hypothetical protein